MTEITIESEREWWRVEIDGELDYVADVYIAGNRLKSGRGEFEIEVGCYSLDRDGRPPALYIEVAPWYSEPKG